MTSGAAQTALRTPAVLAAILAALVLSAALLTVIVTTTPWHPLPRAAATSAEPADPGRDFSEEERRREDAYHREVRPPAYAGLIVGLALAALLGLTPLGARLIAAAAVPLGGGWAARVVMGTVVLSAVGRLVVIPLDARVESVRRAYGLSTRSWAGWAADLAKGWLLATGLTLLALLALYALMRAVPRWWWLPAALGGASLVVTVSFAYPLVVEPVFNSFRPMSEGPLRTSLLRLAEDDEVPVREVLVADASRRTTALNAYVSGFGATRRIVVYDTMLDRASPDEVRLVVAHELAHAKRNDVLHGTLTGALGLAAGVCVIYVGLQLRPLLHRAGVDTAAEADPRSIALVLLLVTVLSTLTGPLQMLVSRRVEARADVHALDLTGDPASFAAMQRRLSLSNLSDLDPSPVVFGLFASHPAAPQRIALARQWARIHGVEEPPPLAP